MRTVLISIILSCVCFCVSRASAEGHGPCDSVLRELLAQPSADILGSWNPKNFTPPAAFRPNAEFRIIVRALKDGFEWRASNIGTLEQQEYYIRQLHLLREDPQKMISSLPSFSGSVISDQHKATFGHAGVVLESPGENIVAASSTDISSTRELGWGRPTEEMFQQLRQKHGVATPGQLLRGSRGHNEVVFRAVSPSGSRVRINGLFVITHDGKPLCSDVMYQVLVEASRRNKLPLLHIED